MLEAERRRRQQNRRIQLCTYYRSFLRRAESRRDINIRTLPNFEDAAQLPCMLPFLAWSNRDTEISPEQFTSVLPSIVAEAQSYRSRVQTELAALHLGQYSAGRKQQSASTRDPRTTTGSSINAEPTDPLTVLEDPTTVFLCIPCAHGRVMSYLGVLEHWQEKHTDYWSAMHIKPVVLERHVFRVVDLQTFSGTVTHTAIHQWINWANLGFKCHTCGIDPIGEGSQLPTHLRFDELVCSQLLHS